ncbi:MAG TPA: LLM class flavin-dependent oxidoreductase [Candidatus Xenobia bacterium]|jgi:alkanesulfonate monooxygenase SsuD/methylene tetrahydromethanopterin reductase-like flavin-dependent oxidoreductase (luciferase family)
MEIALMVEGHEGLTWPLWSKLAHTAERLGFNGLFRSDHYTAPSPPDLANLELWVSLTWLASHTQRLWFGPLVSPVSFREPAMTARMATAVADLSEGRLILGLGAGWQEREHAHYGFSLLAPKPRFQRFAEALDVIRLLFTSEEPFDFEGEFYRLHDVVLRPLPSHRIPILIGGNGVQLTLPLVARHADVWNAVNITPADFRDLNAKLDGLLQSQGRPARSVQRTLMQDVICALRPEEVERAAEGRDKPVDVLKARGAIVGTPDQLAPQVDAYRMAGVERLVLRWRQVEDVGSLEGLARAIL